MVALFPRLTHSPRPATPTPLSSGDPLAAAGRTARRRSWGRIGVVVVPQALLVTLLLVLAGCSTGATTGGVSEITGATSPPSTATPSGGTQSGGTQSTATPSGGSQTGGSRPTPIPAGGAGAQAPSVHEVANSITVEGTSSSPPTDSTVTATCPAGDVALGGGWSVPAQGTQVYYAHLVGNTWYVTVSHQPVLTTLTAYVECLSGAPGAVVTSVPQDPIVVPTSNSSYPTSNSPVYSVDCPTGAVTVGFGFNLINATNNLEVNMILPQTVYGEWESFQVQNHGDEGQEIGIWAECLSDADASVSSTSQEGATEDAYPGTTQVVLSTSCPSGTVVAGGGFAYTAANFYTVGNLYLLHATPGGWQGSVSQVPLNVYGVITSPIVYTVCLDFS